MGEKSVRPQVAIVGGESLRGRELRDLLETSTLGARVKLLASDSSVLTALEGEASVMPVLEERELDGVRMVFLAGSAGASHKALEIVSRRRESVLIDLTHALEDAPGAQLRAPGVEPPGWELPPGDVHVIAHPAAIALALFLRRLAASRPIVRAVAQVFEPASERGQVGVEELQRQTVNLLSFQKLPQKVFDAQLGFNLLVRYGSEAPEPLETVERRIDRHLATLLSRGGGAPRPSIRLAQAPVFHGYSFSVWVELPENPGEEALARELAGPGIEVRSADVEPPTNVGAAGQSEITVGAIETDRNHPAAVWFWLVADNLRLAAENAVAVARAVAIKDAGQ